MQATPESARDEYAAVVAGRRGELDELGIRAYHVKYHRFSGILAADARGVPYPLDALGTTNAGRTRLAGVRPFCQMYMKGRNKCQGPVR